MQRMQTTIATASLSGTFFVVAAIAGTITGTPQLEWYTMDAGGGEVSGGGYMMMATLGQSDSGTAMRGGGFSFEGGVWGPSVDTFPGEVICEQAKLVPVDVDGGDQFGFSVGVRGEFAVAGGHLDDEATGSATVFRREDAQWLEYQPLTSPDIGAASLFGISCSIDDDVIAVGASNDAAKGAVHVFRYDGVDWLAEQKLVASDGMSFDRFGRSVAIRGDLLVVGADGVDDETGAAYIFRYDGSAWNEETKLIANDGETDDRFGFAVDLGDLLGDFVVVGSPRDDDACPGNPDCDAGSAYVFEGDGGVWNQIEKLSNFDDIGGEFFGWSVGMSGGRIAIGARYDEGVGSVTVYEDGGGTWTYGDLLLPETPGIDDEYGTSVAFLGNRLVVGARQGGSIDTGDGYAESWYWNGTTWLREQVLVASDSQLNASFGSAVDTDGTTILLGAPDRAESVGNAAGAAYVFALVSDTDCNGNGEPDACELSGGLLEDCNGNGVADTCDLDSGESSDVNRNGIPDECEEPKVCPGDANSDGVVSVEDLVAVTLDWGTNGSANGGDVDESGLVDVSDLVAVALAWGVCP